MDLRNELVTEVEQLCRLASALYEHVERPWNPEDPVYKSYKIICRRLETLCVQLNELWANPPPK